MRFLSLCLRTRRSVVGARPKHRRRIKIQFMPPRQRRERRSSDKALRTRIARGGRAFFLFLGQGPTRFKAYDSGGYGGFRIGLLRDYGFGRKPGARGAGQPMSGSGHAGPKKCNGRDDWSQHSMMRKQGAQNVPRARPFAILRGGGRREEARFGLRHAFCSGQSDIAEAHVTSGKTRGGAAESCGHGFEVLAKAGHRQRCAVSE